MIEKDRLYWEFKDEWIKAGLQNRDLAKLLLDIEKHYKTAKQYDQQQMHRNMLLALFSSYLKPYPEQPLPIRYPLQVLITETSDQPNEKDDDQAPIKGKLVSIDRVLARLTIELPDLQSVEDIPKAGVLTIDTSRDEALLKRQRNALEGLQAEQSVEPKYMRRLMKPEVMAKNRVEQTNETLQPINGQLDTNQLTAVKKVLDLRHAEYLLVQGPPGTGKTSIIVEAIRQLQRRFPQHRILVASQSNAAVDNVLEGLVKHEPELKAIRFGIKDKIESKVAKGYYYETVSKKFLADTQHQLTKTKELFTGEQQSLRAHWKLMLAEGDPYLEEIMLKQTKLIFGTLVGIASWGSYANLAFDWVIIDEAGRATLPELAICVNKAHRFVLIGDHKQLPPVTDIDIEAEIREEDEIDETLQGKSIFELLYEQLETGKYTDYYHFLDTNYRMHKSIGQLVSTLFYEGKINTPDQLSVQRKHGLPAGLYPGSVAWLSTNGKQEMVEQQHGTSYINSKHIDCLLAIIHEINEALQIPDKGQKKTLAVISPYKAQTNEIKKRLRKIEQKWHKLVVEANTVDAFQGSDRDYVIFDLTRNNPDKQLGHTRSVNRLNVALSRAKSLLIIIGNHEFAHDSKVPEGEQNPVSALVRYILNTDDGCKLQSIPLL